VAIGFLESKCQCDGAYGDLDCLETSRNFAVGPARRIKRYVHIRCPFVEEIGAATTIVTRSRRLAESENGLVAMPDAEIAGFRHRGNSVKDQG
jgi:hypothetical protein